MAANPGIPTRILTGDDRISANPKLNNCVKGWKAARHDWVILADSNVLMPKDYVAHLMAGWRKNTGVVCSTPIGSRPDGFWAEVECMFLNTHQGPLAIYRRSDRARICTGKEHAVVQTSP